jgi:ABC-type branched-subunit amino acid transport system substrate-binding protein
MNQEQKIGVLLPQSNAYPLIGKEFSNGLKLGIGTANAKLIIESIGFGADPNHTRNCIQKLNFQEDVNIITGMLGHHGFNEISQYSSQNEITLLAATLGAKHIENLPEGVFQNSIGLCDSLQDLVGWFAEKKKEKIVTSTCYYESGYDFFKALEQGMNQVENTHFAGHFITPHHPRENEAHLMMETFDAIQPDAVVAFHNGIYAKEHASFLKQNQIQRKYPLYCLPFSCEDQLLKEFPTVFDQVHIISSWFAELDTPENKTFIEDYQKAYGKTPSFFALLGYENGLILRNCLDQPSHQVNEIIEKTTIKGPRGLIAFDDNQKTQYRNYLWSINYNESTSPKREKVEALKAARKIQSTENQDGGWFNAYLCH